MNSAISRSTPFKLEVRKDTLFDFSELNNAIHTERNIYTSHFFNALSLVTPITEGILIRAIREAQPRLQGSELEADAKAFIGQEAIHTREHRRLNRKLAELGFDTCEAIEEIEQEVKKLEEAMSLQQRLALVVTGEHVIYSLARALLNARHEDLEQHDEVKKLFVWHSLEEMEHQSVCDDIYRHLYGTGMKQKLMYYRTYVLVNQLLLRMVSKLMKQLLAQSKKPKSGEFKDFLSWLMFKPGIGATTTKELLWYFTPGFHHWKKDKNDQQLIHINLNKIYQTSI